MTDKKHDTHLDRALSESERGQPQSTNDRQLRLSRRAKHGLMSTVTGLLLLVITGTLIILGQRLQTEKDLSSSARHSLSAQSIETVRSLEDNVEIIAVMGPDATQRQAVEALVSRYRKYQPAIDLSFVNTETQPARVRELDAAVGGELILRTVNPEDPREERLQNLSERSMTEALTRLSRNQDREVAFVTGHGERVTSRVTNSDFSELAKRLQRVGLKTREISLVTEPVVPDSVDLLVIAAPRQEFFPGEVASVLQHISNGGNLLWLLDEKLETGLDALQIELGVEPIAGTLLDASSAAYGADSPTFAIVEAGSLPAHPVNINLGNPLLFPAPTALDVIPLAGQDIQPLIFSGEQSWTESGPVSGEVRFDDNGLERRGPLLLGATITRSKALDGSAEQRIAIIGDADWFASQWIGNAANLEYGERLFNWLTADEQQLAFNTVQPADAFINPSSRSILIMGGGFLVFLPALFLIIAGTLWQRQRRG